MYDFKFADIGDGIEEGKILEWKFKLGDKVKEGDTLVVVETDKVNAELPSPVDGTIVKIGKQEGEMILVGETVVVIDDGTGGAVPEAAEPAQTEAPKAAAPAQGATSGVKATYDFKFADIGDGIEEGKILEWKFKEGDKVNEGDTLVIVETDKVNAELPSPVTGTIVKIGKPEGEMILVGETVVLLDDGSGNYIGGTEVAQAPAVEEEKAASVIGELSVSSDVIESSNEGVAKPAAPTRKKALATPVARNLAKQLNVNIHEVPGTGANGRVMKEDIRKFAEAKKAPAAATQVSTPQANVSRQGDIRVEKISSTRKAISRSMSQSKTIIPETVLMDDVVIDSLVEMRARVKPLAAAKGINITYMAFISRAVIIALKEFEIFNASFDHDNDELVYKNFINLGFAVDTPTGLMVPNIKDADTLSVFDLAAQIRELADKAIDRKLQLPEMRDGTFTITNFGSAGISYGTPVINYPEVAILGVGKISKKPVVVNDEIKIGYVLPLSIAVDHRVIDGADAGRFLTRVKELLENPELMLLS